MSEPMFGRVVTAMVTPFDDDGALNLDGAATLARWLEDHGNDGLVVAGTTGEAPTLTESEKLDLWRAVSEAVTIPVIAGTGTNSTHETVALTSRAIEVGAAGVLVVTPYYNRPTQSGIEGHFRAAAEATTLPVMVYDVPTRTGRRIAFDVLARLATEVSNIAAFKDATGDPAGAARIAAELPDLQIYSGDVALTLAFLAVGAVGVVGTSTHWTGPETGEMIAAFEKGDLVHAREINARLIESYLFENSDACVFSQSIKAMLRTLGLPVGECRLPLGPAPAGTEERAREVYANLRA